jgi:hypothetical protein
MLLSDSYWYVVVVVVFISLNSKSISPLLLVSMQIVFKLTVLHQLVVRQQKLFSLFYHLLVLQLIPIMLLHFFTCKLLIHIQRTITAAVTGSTVTYTCPTGVQSTPCQNSSGVSLLVNFPTIFVCISVVMSVLQLIF